MVKPVVVNPLIGPFDKFCFNFSLLHQLLQFCKPFCGLLNFTKFLKLRLFSRNSPRLLLISASNCISLNLFLACCLETNDRASSTSFGSSPPSILTTLLWRPFRSGLSRLSDSLLIFIYIQSILNQIWVVPYSTPYADNYGWHQFWSQFLPKLALIGFKNFFDDITVFFSEVYFLFQQFEMKTMHCCISFLKLHCCKLHL